jgi:hypothetical protein
MSDEERFVEPLGSLKRSVYTLENNIWVSYAFIVFMNCFGGDNIWLELK